MSKYENGYWPKIQYWTAKLNEAVVSGNLREVDSAHRKLDYFINREWETNGVPTESNVIAGVER